MLVLRRASPTLTQRYSNTEAAPAHRTHSAFNQSFPSIQNMGLCSRRRNCLCPSRRHHSVRSIYHALCAPKTTTSIHKITQKNYKKTALQFTFRSGSRDSLYWFCFPRYRNRCAMTKLNISWTSLMIIHFSRLPAAFPLFFSFFGGYAPKPPFACGGLSFLY